MRTADFIKKHCIWTMCPDFDRDGCHAYDGEECDAAFGHKRWRGKKMADRVTDYCEKQMKKGTSK